MVVATTAFDQNVCGNTEVIMVLGSTRADAVTPIDYLKMSFRGFIQMFIVSGPLLRSDSKTG